MLTSDLIVFVLAILDSSHVHGDLVGEDLATGDEIGVTGVQNSVQHALVEKEVAHPLGDDDVHLGEGHGDLLHLALEKGDPVGKTVHSNDLLGLLNDRGHVHTDDMLSTSASGEPSGLSVTFHVT